MSYILYNSQTDFFVRSTIEEIKQLQANYGLETYRLFKEQQLCKTGKVQSLKTEKWSI